MSVKVVKHPTTGEIITPSSNNPEWGTFRVDSENVSMNGGIVNVSRRSAFIRGKITDLQALGLRDGQVLSGKIQKQESFQPFWDGQSPKINPTSGETVLKNGRETFIQFEYTDDANAPDVWIGEDTTQVSENVQKALAEQAM